MVCANGLLEMYLKGSVQIKGHNISPGRVILFTICSNHSMKYLIAVQCTSLSVIATYVYTAMKFIFPIIIFGTFLLFVLLHFWDAFTSSLDKVWTQFNLEYMTLVIEGIIDM